MSERKDQARPVETIDAAAVVMHVRRGNRALVMPLTAGAAYFTPVGDLAQIVTVELLKQQQASPGRATEPIETEGTAGDVLLGLRPRGAEEPLDPREGLLGQTPGHWRVEDVAIQNSGTARLPVGAFDLIDLERPVLHLGTVSRIARVFGRRPQG